MISQDFLGESRRYLREEYLPSIERAVASLTDAQVWARPNEGSNSIGNLILHLIGSSRQWILEGVDGKPVERVRQQEFDERRAVPKAELIERLREALREIDAALAAVTEKELGETRKIRGNDVTVLQAIYHVVEHFSMHTGQILWIAKATLGKLDPDA
jgi:uncharacterized damage-inducible protein DinB